MKIFKPLYELALKWAAHPKAPWYLGALSFVEAIIFPVAPEIMLAPMVLARPSRWARYATISLVCSLAGALVGYALGHFAFDAMRPVFEWLGWLASIDRLVT
jgi:membrane protein YqaA with SNARE-associated domain